MIIEELESHFNGLALSEAIDFAKENEIWRYWECCVCHEKFGDCQLYRNHMKTLHLLNLDKLELAAISSEWIEMIENGEWKPVDPDVASEIVAWMIKNGDSKRARILERIQEILHLLFKNKCFVEPYILCG